MSAREREGLITRIRQIRRAAAVPARRAPAPDRPGSEAIGALEARVTELEQLVQGLQDSVHREAIRQGKRIADVEARIDPAALGKALSRDARERGL